MVQKISFQGRDAWLKNYGAERWLRHSLVGLWNGVAGRLDLAPLRAPPRYSGARAKDVERRRLEQLRTTGAPVPFVLGEGRDCLILSDMGPTLGRRLRRLESANDADILVERTAAAIGDVHRRGGYLGQAFPRNITIDDQRVGFIDFEEDPSEIMPLAQAQARDWVMFTAGVAPYYIGRADRLAKLLHDEPTAHQLREVEDSVRRVAERLSFVERGCLGRLGSQARALGSAVYALRKSFGVLALAAVLVDYVSDGQLDTWRVLVDVLT
jgi:tRNA A-37 threonylcarbamoyl transferase component Bud32